MGHSFEFLAASFVLWGVVRLRRQDHNPLWSMLLVGAGVTFSLLVRPANVNIVLLPVLVHLLLDLVPGNLGEQPERRFTPGWIASGTALGLAGAFGSNAFLYGTPYPSYGQQYWSPPVNAVEVAAAPSGTALTASSLDPLKATVEFASDTAPRALTAVSRVSDIRTILFTQEFGLFWFMPIVPIGALILIVSLVTLWRRREQRWTVALIAALSAAYAAIPIGVVLVWQSHASSFGFRYLFSLVPLSLLGLALGSALLKRSVFKPLRPILGLLALLSTFSLLGQAFYGTGPTLVLHTASENSFGQSIASNPTFASALLSALLRPEAWANMLSRGYLGFLALVFLPISAISSIGASAEVIPQQRAETLLELVIEYSAQLDASAPGTVFATLLIFGIVLPVATSWMTRTRET